MEPIRSTSPKGDGWPIHCILTDGTIFQFLKCSFKGYSIHRGVAMMEEAVAMVSDYEIVLPDVHYLGQLKIIVNMIFILSSH
jgi:hypothetical protein